jgi:hypothetical protein
MARQLIVFVQPISDTRFEGNLITIPNKRKTVRPARRAWSIASLNCHVAS